MKRTTVVGVYWVPRYDTPGYGTFGVARLHADGRRVTRSYRRVPTARADVARRLFREVPAEDVA